MNSTSFLSLLEKLWLEQELSATVSSNIDGWNKLFAAAGVTSGGFNERQFKWLATLGHTASTLPARLHEFGTDLVAAYVDEVYEVAQSLLQFEGDTSDPTEVIVHSGLTSVTWTTNSSYLPTNVFK